jgi:uncharacterized protein
MTEPPRPPGEDPTSPQPPPSPGYAPPPSGGYSPPPGGGYQAPGGYPQGAVPAGYSSSDDKTWALVAHFGGALGMLIGAGAGGWLPPLIALLVQGNKSPVARAHAIAALNFQLLWSIVGFVGWLTVCLLIGFILWPVAMAMGIIFGIIAGVKANDGQLYRYPATINMIK